MLKDTLGNEQWLRENEAKIKELLPPTWTHMENLNGLKLGFGMKLLGIDWRSEDEFGRVMLFLEKIGILQRQNGYQVRANPSSVFHYAQWYKRYVRFHFAATEERRAHGLA